MSALACDVDAAVWHHYDHEWASQESIQARDGRSRAEARQSYMNDTCLTFTEVGVWARFIRLWTVDEQWEWYREGWEDGSQFGPDSLPLDRPADWRAHEDVPCWSFTFGADDGAIAVWVCGEIAHPPQKTEAPARGVPMKSPENPVSPKPGEQT